MQEPPVQKVCRLRHLDGPDLTKAIKARLSAYYDFNYAEFLSFERIQGKVEEELKLLIRQYLRSTFKKDPSWIKPAFRQILRERLDKTLWVEALALMQKGMGCKWRRRKPRD